MANNDIIVSQDELQVVEIESNECEGGISLSQTCPLKPDVDAAIDSKIPKKLGANLPQAQSLYNEDKLYLESKENQAQFATLAQLLTFLNIEVSGGSGEARGISSIEKTSSEGLVDIYTIRFTDNTTTTYTVTNGKNGTNGSNGKDGANGISATHSWNGTTLTITSASGTSSTDLKGEKGDKGEKGEQGERGIQGERGEKGEQGIQGEKGDTGEQGIPGIQGDRGEDGKDGTNGADGVGISKIEKTNINGKIDTYTIYYTNNTTSAFVVTNGQDGQDASITEADISNITAQVKAQIPYAPAYTVETEAQTKVMDVINALQNFGADISQFNIVSFTGYASDIYGLQISHYGGNVYRIVGINLRTGETTSVTNDWSNKNIGDFQVTFVAHQLKQDDELNTNSKEVVGAINEVVDAIGDVDKKIPTKTSQLTNDSGFLTQHQSLEAYAKKSELPSKTSQLTNDSGFLTNIPSEYVTETELNAKGYLTQHQSLAGYAKTTDHYTKTESDNKYQPKGNYLTSHQDISGKADKSSAETWTFKLKDGSTVTKRVVLA